MILRRGKIGRRGRGVDDEATGRGLSQKSQRRRGNGKGEGVQQQRVATWERSTTMEPPPPQESAAMASSSDSYMGYLLVLLGLSSLYLSNGDVTNQDAAALGSA